MEREKLHLGIRQTLSKKSSVPSFRDTAVRRRHENGAFGIEIFRRIRHERSRSPEIPKDGKPENQRGAIPPFIIVMIP